jgi:hypothetical protein
MHFGDGLLQFCPLTAIRCAKGVVRSAGIAGYVKASAPVMATKGSANKDAIVIATQ